MSKRAKTCGVWLLVCLLLFLSGRVVLKTWRAGRQQEVDRSLVAAARMTDVAKMVALLSQGADPNAREIPADTRSVWKQLWDRVSGQSPPIPTGYQETVLESALPGTGKASPEDLALIKALLDAGANVNVADENGNNTPLMRAIMAEDQEATRLFLESGARTNAHDKWGMTALHFAAYSSSSSVLRMLIARGAPVNARDIFGRTPLHIATLHENVVAARILLAHGAEIDAQEKDGSTPLADAAMYYNPDVVKLLLARGAKVNIRDKEGRTPLTRTARTDDDTVYDMLKKAGAKE